MYPDGYLDDPSKTSTGLFGSPLMLMSFLLEEHPFPERARTVLPSVPPENACPEYPSTNDALKPKPTTNHLNLKL